MIAKLKKTIVEMKDIIRQRYKAEIRGIFGSYVRSDFHADSDLDLLVDFDDGANLFDMIGLQHFLEDKLGCKVDLGTESSLREEIRESVLNEAIYL